MPRGGARKGSGRKVGATTKKTKEIAEKAIAEGITPLEYMLKVMRDPTPLPEDASAAQVLADRMMKFEAAKAAAPYLHPRLSSVEMNANVTNHEASLDELE
jgi:hypothetical protein